MFQMSQQIEFCLANIGLRSNFKNRLGDSVSHPLLFLSGICLTAEEMPFGFLSIRGKRRHSSAFSVGGHNVPRNGSDEI